MVFLMLLVLSCSSPEASKPDPADELLSTLSTRQKVAQLFIVLPEALESFKDDTLDIGGFCVFAYHIADQVQLDSMVRTLKSGRRVNPLLCIDEEGGRVARLGNHPAFPHLRRFPNLQERAGIYGRDSIYATANYIGRYLKEYGFDVDFAPIADVDTNSDNPVIGVRALSKDPAQAAEMVCAYMHGLHDAGVVSCLKHYPGHGDTSGDSHKGFVSISRTWEEMLECELVPFAAAIKEGAPMVMVGHISAPSAVPDTLDVNLPATLSEWLMTQKLRGELGFQGLIITDSMRMGAISSKYSCGESAVMAIEAGADILLMPGNLNEAYGAVLEAVESGRLSMERIDGSVRRILSLKLGLI